MRTRLVALVLSAATIGGAAAIAEAGPAAVDANGNFAMLDVDVSPPQAGARNRPQGVQLGFHYFTGNRETGSRPPNQTSGTIRLPRGLVTNAELFPACALPRNAQEFGQKRCTRAQRIGSGTGEADARPAIAEPIPFTFVAYNGAPRNGNGTIVFLADARVGDQTITTELDFEIRREVRGQFGSALVSLPPPEGVPAGDFSMVRLDFNLGRNIVARIRGQRTRVSYFEAPTTCRRSWRFSNEAVFADNAGTLTAIDDAPCVAAHRD